jgi:hypothetical protein
LQTEMDAKVKELKRISSRVSELETLENQVRSFN